MFTHVPFIAGLLEEALIADGAAEVELAALSLHVQRQTRLAAERLVAAVTRQRRAVHQLVVLQQHRLARVRHVALLALKLLARMHARMTRQVAMVTGDVRATIAFQLTHRFSFLSFYRDACTMCTLI